MIGIAYNCLLGVKNWWVCGVSIGIYCILWRLLTQYIKENFKVSLTNKVNS